MLLECICLVWSYPEFFLFCCIPYVVSSYRVIGKVRVKGQFNYICYIFKRITFLLYTLYCCKFDKSQDLSTYQLFDEANPVNKEQSRYIFTTEGHILPLDRNFHQRPWEEEWNLEPKLVEIKSSSRSEKEHNSKVKMLYLAKSKPIITEAKRNTSNVSREHFFLYFFLVAYWNVELNMLWHWSSHDHFLTVEFKKNFHMYGLINKERLRLKFAILKMSCHWHLSMFRRDK